MDDDVSSLAYLRYQRSDLNGVRGWLVVIIIIFILTPFQYFSIVSTFSSYTWQRASSYSGMQTFIALNLAFCGIAIVAYYACAIGFMMRAKGAVSLARYIIIAEIARLLLNSFYIFTVYPSVRLQKLGDDLLGILILLAEKVIVLAYLCKSRRIAITYGFEKPLSDSLLDDGDNSKRPSDDLDNYHDPLTDYLKKGH